MEYKSLTLRIPQTLHKTLLDIAHEKSKSLNAEIINRLQNSLTVDNERVSLKNIRQILREELANKEVLHSLKKSLLNDDNQIVTRGEVEDIARNIVIKKLRELNKL